MFCKIPLAARSHARFQRWFDWNVEGTKLTFTYKDVDGSEGFPGDVDVSVTYEMTPEGELVMDYQATANKPTPIDLGNHFMVNLAGHVSN